MQSNPIDRLMSHLQSMIAVCGLELLERYPNDLLVHDRTTFEKFWSSGQRFGWMVGNSHSHLVALGLHPEDNIAVIYFLNLSPDDRFFEIVVESGAVGFRITEISSAAFAELRHASVPYVRRGSDTSFSLDRNGKRIGTVSIVVSGGFQNRYYHATLAPSISATKTDRAAMHVWSDFACRRLAGTLFYRGEYDVIEPLALLTQAA